MRTIDDNNKGNIKTRSHAKRAKNGLKMRYKAIPCKAEKRHFPKSPKIRLHTIYFLSYQKGIAYHTKQVLYKGISF